MQNLVLSTRNIDDLISEIANEVVKKIGYLNLGDNKKPSEEKLLTIEEASVLLSLTVPTIYSKVSRNELPYMKRGKRLYFSDKELKAYIKGGKRKSNAELDAEASDYLMKKGGINAL